MSRILTSAERRDLKARAHALHPLVMIGSDGLTAAVLMAVDEALRSHELVKIRAAGEDRAAREALLGAICAATGASPVQHIGKVLVVWRERPPEPADESPTPRTPRSAARAKPSPRAARSGRTPGAAGRGASAPEAVSRPGRAPRLLPRRGRPTRSGRR